MKAFQNKTRQLLARVGGGAFLALFACLSGNSYAVPSFARQTNMPCSACHTVFPELTSFGRSFKLNGYTLAGIPQVSQDETGSSGGVGVNSYPPLSAMAQAGFTHMAKADPDTQNNDLQFPQQLSLFYAGRISDRLGAFVQLTYDQPSGSVGLDNTDIRYAKTATAGGQSLTYGVTLNNNPTVQDIWNSTPAWGFPYLASGSASASTAAPVIAQLGQDVTGLGLYALWNNAFYGEITAYRSSHQAQAKPDVTSDNTIQGVAPYVRLAWQHAADNGDYLMLGLNGFRMDRYRATGVGAGGGITGPTDQYEDKTVDAQYEHPMNANLLVFHASYTQEDQTLGASSPGFSPSLKTAKVDGSFHLGNRMTTTLAYWNTTGDNGDYSNTYGYVGSPDNSGWIAEMGYLPWQNARFSLQYTAYQKFDGLPAGRSASDNNTTFLQAWFVW